MAMSTPLFVLFAGANDILFNPNISASQSYKYLVQAQNLLQGVSAEAKVLTLSPPDLSRLPYGFYVDKLAKEQLRTYGNLLEDLLDTSETGAVNVDLRSLFDDFDYYATPQAYGFKPLGMYGSCLTGAYGEAPNITTCEDAEKHVYWDEYQ
jgi:phospholipase/lecithinase/hemolysin